MNRLLEYIYKNIYTRIFPDYARELEKACKNCETILDLGCGSHSAVGCFSKKIYSEGVDKFLPYIKQSRAKRIHNKYHLLDVLDAGKHFKDNSFDCVLASDVIEHLTKKEGFKLIEAMRKIASKKAIIFTPNGFMPQSEREGNVLQEHKSGWTAEEMKNLGFEVKGIGGFKYFKNDDTSVKFRPKIFWKIISDLTQFYARRYPKNADQILCVKYVNKD